MVFYVPPFWLGVLATLCAEVAVLVILAWVGASTGKKSKP